MTLELYTIKQPQTGRAPILLSSPHSGTFFPQILRDRFLPEVVACPQNTDWFVEKLYDFAPSLGAFFIHANFSRFVIDLNRDPENKKLYSDGRKETGLVSTCTFEQTPIYKNDELPHEVEVEQRIELYYWPYYRAIEKILNDIKNQYGYALFFDCHSIKRVVKSIQDAPFPDMILGDQDGKTSHSLISEVALKSLRASPYQVTYNHPFKGGHLTRYFGKPQNHIHALQLEMSQDIYMNPQKIEYDMTKANDVRKVLSMTISKIIETAHKLYETN